MTISWRGAALIALGVIPVLFFPTTTFAWLWIIAVGLLCSLDAFLAADPASLTFRRSVESTIRADEVASSRVELSNPGRRNVRVELRDAWPPSLSPTPARHSLYLPSGDTVSAVTTLRPTRRGTRSSDRVSIRVWGPLGLAARQKSFDSDLSFAVLPPFIARRLLPSRLARLNELEGSTATVLRGPGTEFDSLREYVRGDDPRDIDWKASARAPELMVRTWRPERDRHVVIVVDAGRAGAELLGAPQNVESDANAIDLGEAPRMDAGIEAALLLAVLAQRAGDNVHFLAIDSQVRAHVSGRRAATVLNSIATSLVDVSPSVTPIDWPEVCGEVDRIVRHRSLIVLLTEIPAIGSDPSFIEAIGRLTRRHVVMVGNALDPSAVSLASTVGEDSNIYTQIAASESLYESGLASRDIQRLGVHTVDVDAGRLPAHIVDTYIELKKAGIL